MVTHIITCQEQKNNNVASKLKSLLAETHVCITLTDIMFNNVQHIIEKSNVV